jgi:large subunit ribosomal protein L24
MMADKFRFKKGDFVIVISGEDKGRKGRILKVYPKTNRVIVEKVHMIKKHSKPSQKNPQGGVIHKEAPVNASNVMLFNDKLNTVSKPIISVHEGHRVRICKKSGDEI